MRFSLRPLAVERPLGPLRGHKLAYPLLSVDGRAAAFRGIWSSAQPVYRVRDSASCFWNNRHDPPIRRCGCGFYCLDSFDAARAMACEGRYRSTVILEVELSGRFIRYEQGYRYSDQRVLTVHLNRCECGRPASVLVDSGTGTTGWLQLEPSCSRCNVRKEAMSPSEFGTLLGDPAVVVAAESPAGGDPECPAPITPLPDNDTSASIGVLAAELALLQTRVDNLEAQLARRTG